MYYEQNIHMMGPRPGPPETPGIKTRAAGFGGSPFWASRGSQVSLRLLIVYIIYNNDNDNKVL